MDRDDARFVADALACRIAGDREGLDRLAASSLMQITTLAKRIRELADDWPPAHYGAAELMAIGRKGGKICDDPPSPQLQIFVDKMLELVGEAPRAVPRNRADRRAQAKSLPRAARIGRAVPARLVN